jgi:hypothetical protein
MKTMTTDAKRHFALTLPSRLRAQAAFLLISTAISSQAAGSTTLTFDSLATGYNSVVPNGYGGFNWANFYVQDGATLGFGYYNGVVSSPNIALNGNGNPAQFSSSASFNLNSAYLTAAYDENLSVEVQGFSGSLMAYDKTYTIQASGPSLINFGYLGITEVNFISSGGYPYYPSQGYGYQFAMDNLNITFTPTPEPSSLALVALAGALISRRRMGQMPR